MKKENLIMTPANQEAFMKSMDKLSNSIHELQRITQNMIPETIVRIGLDTAVKGYCQEITKSRTLPVSYQSVGMNAFSSDQTTAIIIYRIVQELINNTVKHAAAKQVLVHLQLINNKMTITVEDDGQGFDPAGLPSSHGIGWNAISSHVEFLKGVTNIQSAAGKGTAVRIEIGI